MFDRDVYMNTHKYIIRTTHTLPDLSIYNTDDRFGNIDLILYFIDYTKKPIPAFYLNDYFEYTLTHSIYGQFMNHLIQILRHYKSNLIPIPQLPIIMFNVFINYHIFEPHSRNKSTETRKFSFKYEKIPLNGYTDCNTDYIYLDYLYCCIFIEGNKQRLPQIYLDEILTKHNSLMYKCNKSSKRIISDRDVYILEISKFRLCLSYINELHESPPLAFIPYDECLAVRLIQAWCENISINNIPKRLLKQVTKKSESCVKFILETYKNTSYEPLIEFSDDQSTNEK